MPLDNEFSLQPEGRPEELLSLRSEDVSPVLPDSVTRLRASKAQFGWKDYESPGEENIYTRISQGREKEVREEYANAKSRRTREQKIGLIQEIARSRQGPVTEEEMNLVMQASEEDIADPRRIFEKEYRTQWMNQLPLLQDGDNDVYYNATEFPVETAKALTWGQQAMTKLERIKTMAQNKRATIEQTGPLEAIADIAGAVVPGLWWYRTHNLVPDAPTTSVLPGTNVREQIAYIYSLPEEDGIAAAEKAVDSLSNNIDKLRFLHMLEHPGSSQELLDNVFAVVDVGIAGDFARMGAQGFIRGLRRGPTVSVRPFVGGQTETTPITSNVVKAIVDAAAKPNASTEEIFDAAGDVEAAAMMRATKRVQAALVDKDPVHASFGVLSQLPSVFFASKIGVKAGTRSREFTNRLTTEILERGADIVEAITRPGAVTPVPGEAMAKAIEVASAKVKQEYNRLGDAIAEVVHIPGGMEAGHGDHVAMVLNRPDGRPFKTIDNAEYWAKEQFKLEDGSYFIDRQGTSWSIFVPQPVDLGLDVVKDLMVTTKNMNPDSWINALIGVVRGRLDSVSQLHQGNLHIATHGPSQLEKVAREVVEPIRAMRKDAREELIRVLEHNRDAYSPGGRRGQLYESIGDLENGWISINGHLPSDEQIRSYFSYVSLYDMDYMLRTLGIWRDKVRAGGKSFNVKVRQEDPQSPGTVNTLESPVFDGKLVDALPRSGRDYGIVMMEKSGQNTVGPVYRRRSQVSAEDWKEIDGMRTKGYQVIQVAEPMKRPFARVI